MKIIISALCFIASFAFLIPVRAEEVKVLSVSPDKKIEIFTKVGKDHSSYEGIHGGDAKETLLGSGIYARFVGTDSPDSALWNADDSSVKAYIEWDESSTRLLVMQGDAKSWVRELFILRKDVRTGYLFLEKPDLPDPEGLLYRFAKIAQDDYAGPWRFRIQDWKNADSIILSLDLENAGWIAGKEGCQISFHFATKDLHNFTLNKIDYTGTLPSESERWYDQSKPPYKDKIKTLYPKANKSEMATPRKPSD